MLTWRLLFFWTVNTVPLFFLGGRKGKLCLGGFLFTLFLLLSILDCPWGSGNEKSLSLSSRSLWEVKSSLRFLWCRLSVRTASGTGFWVMNRLSPESLKTKLELLEKTHRHKYTLLSMFGTLPYLSSSAGSLERSSCASWLTEVSLCRCIFFTWSDGDFSTTLWKESADRISVMESDWDAKELCIPSIACPERRKKNPSKVSLNYGDFLLRISLVSCYMYYSAKAKQIRRGKTDASNVVLGQPGTVSGSTRTRCTSSTWRSGDSLKTTNGKQDQLLFLLPG